MVDALDSKSCVLWTCRFESDHRYLLNNNELLNRGHPSVDTLHGVVHDKIGGAEKCKPFMRIKYGNAVVPIYKARPRKYDDYSVAFHMNGRRVRQNFSTLEKAMIEAQIVAKRFLPPTRSTAV